MEADALNTEKLIVRDELRRKMRRRLGAVMEDYVTTFKGESNEGAVAFADDLVELVPAVSPALEHEGVALALVRGAAARAEMLRAPQGPCVSAEIAARIVGISKPRILEKAKEGGLFGVRLEKQGAVRFPTWQFDEKGRVREGLVEVVQTFREISGLDDWAVLTFFLTPRESLRGKAPVDLLIAGDAKRLKALAKAHVG